MASGDEGSARMVCLGVIAGARGLNGEVRVRSFTGEPAAIASYGRLTDAARTRRFRLTVRACRRDEVIAAIDGVTGRSDAEALRGLHLFVERSALPAPAADEFYIADLIGLTADLRDAGGALVTAAFGRVRDVVDVGGGPLLDIVRPSGEDLLVPFSRAAVPVVDLAAGRIAIAELPGLISADGDGEPVAASRLAEAG
ncbi:MAG: ribosome maturation factor RimM [Rhodospirillales bacterium]|nr:ribosome maturation factor RimM [Rhodospirillales bacterium]